MLNAKKVSARLVVSAVSAVAFHSIEGEQIGEQHQKQDGSDQDRLARANASKKAVKKLTQDVSEQKDRDLGGEVKQMGAKELLEVRHADFPRVENYKESFDVALYGLIWEDIQLFVDSQGKGIESGKTILERYNFSSKSIVMETGSASAYSGFIIVSLSLEVKFVGFKETKNAVRGDFVKKIRRAFICNVFTGKVQEFKGKHTMEAYRQVCEESQTCLKVQNLQKLVRKVLKGEVKSDGKLFRLTEKEVSTYRAFADAIQLLAHVNPLDFPMWVSIWDTRLFLAYEKPLGKVVKIVSEEVLKEVAKSEEPKKEVISEAQTKSHTALLEKALRRAVTSYKPSKLDPTVKVAARAAQA